MCGIAGIIDFDEKVVPADWLATMNRAQRHRGPDGNNVAVFKNVGMAHTRLAIIDLSEQAAQPFQRDTLVISYNGEIFNYLELKRELLDLGHRFVTQSDTEVILAAYQQWGGSCVKHFYGMWSFALYDQQKQILFCSRDRFGEKPFYYTFYGNRFFFASTIRAIVEVTGHKKANRNALANFFLLDRCEFAEETFFEGIKKIPASHNALLDLNRKSFKLERYYEPDACHPICIDEDDAAHQLEQMMQQSVAQRLRSDVEVGTCVSGGLDSGYLAISASEILGSKRAKSFKGFSIGSGHISNDEMPEAKQVAETAGIQWFGENAKISDWPSLFDDLVHCQEEPFNTNSLFMQHQVMNLAANNGVKVLLDGQGADETWIGYPAQIAIFLRRISVAKAVQAMPCFMRNNSLSMAQYAALRFYHAYPFRKLSFRLLQLKPLLHKTALDGLERAWLMRKEEAIRASMSHYQLFEMYEGSLPALLRYEDKNAMRFGVETRLPYLHHELVDFALKLPDHLKVFDGWTKYLLRKVASGKMPHNLVWRTRKIGFEAPPGWLPYSMDNIKALTMASPLLSAFYMQPHKALRPANAMAMLCVARWEKIFEVEI